MDEKLVCPCGLTCCDCLFYKTEIYDAANQLKDLLEKHNLVKFLTICSRPESLEVLGEHLGVENGQVENSFSSSFETFKHLPEFMTVLDGLINLQCKSTCKEVGGCSIGGNKHECKALQCIRAKGYEGCWQCDEFETCDKLSMLKRNYGYVIEENLKIIKEKGASAVESRGDKYYAWQRR